MLYSFVLNLICNESQTNYTPSVVYFDPNNSAFIINATTSASCPLFTLSQISDFITTNWIPFTICGTVIGLLECFLGFKLFVPTLFFAGFLSAFFVSFIILFDVIVQADSSENVKWIILIFSIVMGVFVGFITSKTVKVGFFVLGAWLGTILSLILFNAFLYKIQVDPPELLLYISMGILGLFFGVLAIVFYQVFVIISTSICGAYITVRAISLPIGGFPNEFAIAEQIQNSNLGFTVQWQFYVYMNAIIVMALISMWVQWKIKKRSDSKLEQEDVYFKQGDDIVL